MIYVVAHKFYDPPKLDDSYQTIYVGDKVQKKAKESGYIVDSEGISISERNPYYCELTALYWAWKNDTSGEWGGLNHYRRYFLSDRTHEILTRDEIESLLSTHDVILWNEIVWPESVEWSYYRGAGYRKDILLLKNIMNKLYPDYINAFETVLKGKTASYANMFVMRRDFFDDYCEWLFSLLFEMEKTLNMSGYTVQEKRVYGYLGEILLNVYVKKNELIPAYCDVYNTEVGSPTLKDTMKNVGKKLIKRIIYFPYGIKYKRLYVKNRKP